MFGQHDRTTQQAPPPAAQGNLPDSLPPAFDVPRFLADMATPADAPALCVRCGAPRTDEARCGECGWHADDVTPLPRYEGTWRVSLGRPGGF